MFRILRYLILISLISSGYYLFISEYLNISEKYFFEEEIIKKEIVEDKKEIIQEKKEEEVATPNINKNIDKEQFVEKKIEILQGDTFVSILENLNFKQKKIMKSLVRSKNLMI